MLAKISRRKNGNKKTQNRHNKTIANQISIGQPYFGSLIFKVGLIQVTGFRIRRTFLVTSNSHPSPFRRQFHIYRGFHVVTIKFLFPLMLPTRYFVISCVLVHSSSISLYYVNIGIDILIIVLFIFLRCLSPIMI